MSDEYSLHGRFLFGLDSAAEYERRLKRLREADQRVEDERALLPSPVTDRPSEGVRVLPHEREDE